MKLRTISLSVCDTRALAKPKLGQADPATIFLHKVGGKWEGLTLGTGFSPDDFDKLHIPARLRR